jgi:hypothetical protein
MTTQSWRAIMGLAGLGVAWAGSADAALISFTEDPAEVAPIAVATDLTGATKASTLGNASLSLGNVTGTGNFLLNIALIQQGTGQQTGGGKGVSDILELLSFVSGGSVVGFEAIYLSDKGGPGLPNPGFPAHPTYCSTLGGPEPVCPPGQPNSEFEKTGGVMSFSELVTVPGGSGPTALEVDIRSPLQGSAEPKTVPEPAGLALFGAGLVALGMLAQRRGYR